jgi:hypothetical protein
MKQESTKSTRASAMVLAWVSRRAVEDGSRRLFACGRHRSSNGYMLAGSVRAIDLRQPGDGAVTFSRPTVSLQDTMCLILTGTWATTNGRRAQFASGSPVPGPRDTDVIASHSGRLWKVFPLNRIRRDDPLRVAELGTTLTHEPRSL